MLDGTNTELKGSFDGKRAPTQSGNLFQMKQVDLIVEPGAEAKAPDGMRAYHKQRHHTVTAVKRHPRHPHRPLHHS